MDHLRKTGISSWCHSSLCHSTDLKGRCARFASAGLRIAICPNVIVIPSSFSCEESAVGFLQKGLTRQTEDPIRRNCTCLCGTGVSPVFNKRASGSLPEAHRIYRERRTGRSRKPAASEMSQSATQRKRVPPKAPQKNQKFSCAARNTLYIPNYQLVGWAR